LGGRKKIKRKKLEVPSPPESKEDGKNPIKKKMGQISVIHKRNASINNP